MALLRGGRGEAELAEVLAGLTPRDPFTGAAMDWLTAAELLGEWRRLIEANRGVSAVFGVAGWKRETTDALLWDGSAVRHRRRCGGLGPGDRALAWIARAPVGLADELALRGCALGEIEDGWVRSAGLGADCVPPLSIVVDHRGSAVDPSRPSDLECLLAEARVDADLLARARRLRNALVAGGIGKYGAAGLVVPVAQAARRRVLVVGQVEDDRAVLLGGAGCDNRGLLARARALEPGAELIYKPHPDVEAGHRRGALAEAEVLGLADRIERERPMAALLAEVAAVHVISSGAGFEALLRGREVVCHGVPWYAGWGLTKDLAPPPRRRRRRLGVDEMVGIALIRYARYLDPVTRLPCGPETVVARLAAGEAEMGGALVALRRVQGRVRRWLRAA